jgi:hypothetical protein
MGEVMQWKFYEGLRQKLHAWRMEKFGRSWTVLRKLSQYELTFRKALRTDQNLYATEDIHHKLTKTCMQLNKFHHKLTKFTSTQHIWFKTKIPTQLKSVYLKIIIRLPSSSRQNSNLNLIPISCNSNHHFQFPESQTATKTA